MFSSPSGVHSEFLHLGNHVLCSASITKAEPNTDVFLRSVGPGPPGDMAWIGTERQAILQASFFLGVLERSFDSRIYQSMKHCKTYLWYQGNVKQVSNA